MTKIIAEIANTHQGDIKYLSKITDLFFDEADFIKFQIYTAHELLSKRHKRFNHFNQQAISFNNWYKILSKYNKNKILCDVFGIESFNFVNDSDFAGIKIHNSYITNLPLLDHIANNYSNNKLIFISCGGVFIHEIEEAINILSNFNLVLMHGYQAYPTNLNDTNINKLILIKEKFGNK